MGEANPPIQNRRAPRVAANPNCSETTPTPTPSPHHTCTQPTPRPTSPCHAANRQRHTTTPNGNLYAYAYSDATTTHVKYEDLDASAQPTPSTTSFRGRSVAHGSTLRTFVPHVSHVTQAGSEPCHQTSAATTQARAAHGNNSIGDGARITVCWFVSMVVSGRSAHHQSDSTLIEVHNLN